MDAYSKLTIIYGVENITNEEFMDKLDMFQSRFGKADKFGWWDLEQTQTDSGMQFTSKDFKEVIYVCGVGLKLAAPDHQ